MKKILSFIMAACMTATLLAGCGAGAPKSTATAASQTATSAAASTEEPTSIIWMVRWDEPKNNAAVMEKLNAQLLKDLNMTLDMRFIAPGDYNQKMQMAMAGGDEWDLCFTSAWANNYVNAAGKGAYLALDDLLEKHAPDVLATVPEKFWDGVRVNGNIYGMINYQVMYDQGGQRYLKSVVDEMGIDVAAIKTFDDLIKVLKDVQAKHPEMSATRGLGVSMPMLAFQPEAVNTILGQFIGYDPATKKVSLDYAMEKYAPIFAAAREVKENNLQPADAATLKDETTLINNGQIFNRYERIKPGTESMLKANTGLDWVVAPTCEKFIDTAAVQSTVTAVNANSKNPEKAIELYNYLYTNKEAFNTLVYGIEGQDYNLEDGRVAPIEGGYAAQAWMVGNQFNALVRATDAPDVWEQTMKGNEEAVISPLYGYVADRAPIETEMASCEAVWGEYKDILMYGLDDTDKAVSEMKAKMESAGIEKVIAELQAQVDAFLAAK